MRDDTRVKLSTSRPIRVMRIIARMNAGGPAVQISGLMRGFDSQLFDQRLFTGFCSEGEVDYLENIATDIYATRILGFGRRLSVRGDIRAFHCLVSEIRKFKPHVIHTHTFKAGLLGRAASVISLCPSIRIHTFHGHLLNGYFGGFKRLLIILIERVLSMFTHQLLAVGEKVRQDLLNVGIGRPNTFGIMPPGVEIGPLPNKTQSQEFFSLQIPKLQCAFIGRVTQVKRPDRFLDVVYEIKKRGVPLDFFIAGDGDLLDECRVRINAEKLPVKILGWQNDIEKVLSAADIVLLTSDNEGTPLSLIQAGMAGLPVVTTRVGSVPEVVIDSKTGIVCELDVQIIADALEELFNDNALRALMGKAARDFTLRNFGVKRLVDDHQNLYTKLLK